MAARVIEFNPPEPGRTYHFTDGDQIVIANLVELRISQSGHHYLTTAEGRRYIVPPRWLVIQVEADHWTQAG